MNHDATMNANDNDHDLKSDAKSYGHCLRTAREALGLTLEEVSVELHLAKDMMMHIEQEMLHALPDPIFVRGYLRAYAKLVQVDPNQIIASFNQVCAPSEPKKLNLGKHIVIKESKATEKPIRWVSYMIFVGLIVWLLMWWHGHNGQSNSNNATMAALATLKPVSDSQVSATSSTTTVTVLPSPANAGSSTSGAAIHPVGDNTPTLAASATTKQAPVVNSPNAIVNTGVTNLAPSANATPPAPVAAASIPTTAAPPSSQTMANTPIPVASSQPQALPKAKAKPAASAWRNPDLE